MPAEGHTPASLASQSDGSRQPRRRALLVGVQYFNHRQLLAGTTYDVLCMAHVLISRAGFLPKDVVILTDTMYDRGEELSMFPGERVQLPDFAGSPTHDRIIEQIEDWDLPQAQPGDSFFFHFSGHGTQCEHPKGSGHYVEGLVPCEGGTIWDWELEDLVLKLPALARMHVFLDCCHASGALNLPFIVDFNAHRRRRRLSNLFGLFSTATQGYEHGWKPDLDAREITGRNFGGIGHVVQLSACSSTQTARSVDPEEHQEEPGIATYLFIQAVTTLEGQGTSFSELKYKQVMDAMHNTLAEWLTFRGRLRPLIVQNLTAEISAIMFDRFKDYKVQELQLGSVHTFNIEDCICL